MNTLKKEQLINIRDHLLACINKSAARRASLVSSGDLTRELSLKIAKSEKSLQNLADDFNLAIFKEVVADIEEPGNKIMTATTNLKIAIGKLQAINGFIGILAALIGMTSKILMAFSTGNSLQIAALLSEIEAFV